MQMMMLCGRGFGLAPICYKIAAPLNISYAGRLAFCLHNHSHLKRTIGTLEDFIIIVNVSGAIVDEVGMQK